MKLNLTKKQRHDVYKKAKEFYTNAPTIRGMCTPIILVVEELYNVNLEIEDLHDTFTEFAKLRPTGKKIYSFWWHIGYTTGHNRSRDKKTESIRLKKFDQIIGETK